MASSCSIVGKILAFCGGRPPLATAFSHALADDWRPGTLRTGSATIMLMDSVLARNFMKVHAWSGNLEVAAIPQAPPAGVMNRLPVDPLGIFTTSHLKRSPTASRVELVAHEPSLFIATRPPANGSTPCGVAP